MLHDSLRIIALLSEAAEYHLRLSPKLLTLIWKAYRHQRFGSVLRWPAQFRTFTEDMGCWCCRKEPVRTALLIRTVSASWRADRRTSLAKIASTPSCSE